MNNHKNVHDRHGASVRRYFWRQGHGYGTDVSEPGFRFEGTTGGYCWVSSADAWEIAETLADMLDEDVEKGRA